MASTPVTSTPGVLGTTDGATGMPALLSWAGGNAEKCLLEFFADQIRARDTREAYLRAVCDFLGYAQTEAARGFELDIYLTFT